MDTILKFVATLVDGTQEVQEIPLSDVPDSKALEGVVMQAFTQYANVGLVRKFVQDNRFVLIPCGQISRVEVTLPSITIASSLDINAMAQAADKLRKIIP